MPIWDEKGTPVRQFDLAPEERVRQLAEQQAEAAKRQHNFVSMLGTHMPLAAGPHALLGPTGSGKTNTVANLVHSALHTTKGDIICILNEETAVDFVTRIACIELALDMADYKKGLFTNAQKEAVKEKTSRIVHRVRTFGGEGGWNVNALEDVLELIARAATASHVSFVVVDYLQNISENKSNAESFTISKAFGTRLKEVGKTSSSPIVVACQIRKGNEPYSQRVQNDKTFVNNCASVMEVVSDFQNRITDIIIRKDRWYGYTDACFSFDFVVGRLLFAKQERRAIVDTNFMDGR
jgi:hypothetical protein